MRVTAAEPASLARPKSRILTSPPAVAGDHQVGRLDVAVDDALAVGLGQPAGHLLGDVGRLVHRQRPALDLAAQGLAVVAGHGEVEPAVLGLAHLEDRAEVGVVERRGRPRLLQEAGLGHRVARQLRRQELERHRAAEPGVLGLVDHAHAAAAQELQDAVGADRPAGEGVAGLRRAPAEGVARGLRQLEQRRVVPGHRFRRSRSGQRAQIPPQGLHARVAAVRLLGESLRHDPLQPLRHARAKLGQRGRIALQDRPHHLPLREVLEREAAGHHLVDHDAQGPDVRAGIRRHAPELLRGHVGRRAHGHAGPRQARLVAQAGDAEVQELDLPAGRQSRCQARCQDNIRRLHVAVHHPPLMGAGEAGGDLGGHLDRLGHRQGAAVQPAAQRLPLVEGHGDEQRAVLGLADLVDGADVGMVDLRSGPCLAQEPPLLLLGGAALAGEELQRHQAAELQVAGLVDHAHAAAAEALQDLIVRDGAADHGGGLCSANVGFLGRPESSTPKLPRQVVRKLLSSGTVTHRTAREASPGMKETDDERAESPRPDDRKGPERPSRGERGQDL